MSHIVIILCTRIEKTIEFGDILVNAKYVNLCNDPKCLIMVVSKK